MGENVRLANIYIKIYNKRPLMMDDLAFLAKYDPECFEKTCHNLVYNVPEAKKLMEAELISTESAAKQKGAPVRSFEVKKEEKEKEKPDNTVEILFENIKKLEGDEFGLLNTKLEHVKNLLGSLFMEMLFPHNDKEQTFEMAEVKYTGFDKEA